MYIAYFAYGSRRTAEIKLGKEAVS